MNYIDEFTCSCDSQRINVLRNNDPENWDYKHMLEFLAEEENVPYETPAMDKNSVCIFGRCTYREPTIAETIELAEVTSVENDVDQTVVEKYGLTSSSADNEFVSFAEDAVPSSSSPLAVFKTSIKQLVKLNIGSWNCNSILCYMGVIKTMIKSHNLQILCLQEPGIKFEKFENSFPDFLVIASKNLNDAKKAGSVMLIHKSIQIIDIIDFDIENEFKSHVQQTCCNPLSLCGVNILINGKTICIIHKL